ncbi:hotdog family protein, partial [Mycobacterium avium]
PLQEGGWSFRVDSRPYGVPDAEWSLNADGTVVAGIEDEPAADPADHIDAVIERLDRNRPQLLFDSFAESELEWGTTWS